jgi:hypothetical protein
MQLTIQVRNAELVGKGLANIRAAIPKISEATIKKSANAVIRRMKIYPPPPSKSKYVRTYRLQRSWRAKRSATGYTISADPVSKYGVRYGRYVVGFADSTGQAWMHVGRWNLLRDVLEDEVSKLPPMVEEHIRLTARREGLA